MLLLNISKVSYHILRSIEMKVSLHYRKHIYFRGPKTHENKHKPTKKAIFICMPTKIAVENKFNENMQLFSLVPT
jgi:hypothetical protein